MTEKDVERILGEIERDPGPFEGVSLDEFRVILEKADREPNAGQKFIDGIHPAMDRVLQADSVRLRLETERIHATTQRTVERTMQEVAGPLHAAITAVLAAVDSAETDHGNALKLLDTVLTPAIDDAKAHLAEINENHSVSKALEV